MDYIVILIVLAIAGIVFTILFRKGFFLRFANYIRETREELKKCTWPTLEELRGSTIVVMVAILLLGGFTILVDLVVSLMIQLVT